MPSDQTTNAMDFPDVFQNDTPPEPRLHVPWQLRSTRGQGLEGLHLAGDEGRGQATAWRSGAARSTPVDEVSLQRKQINDF